MANTDLLKQAVAEAKSIREAAIANAKSQLEETLTPHLKDLLAAKLQEMEDSQVEEEFVVNEEGEEEEDAMDAENGAEAEDAEESPEGEEESPEGEEEVGNLSVDEFKEMIRDIISQELEAESIPSEEEGEDLGSEMDGGDAEGMGENPAPALDAPAEEEEINLDELLAELLAEEEEVEATEEPSHDSQLEEALATIEELRQTLQEVNLLNAKLLYVNKIFKASNLTESQKANIIATFDKAETIREAKLVFETVSESVAKKEVKTSIKESRMGTASSQVAGTSIPQKQIVEVSDSVRRMQQLAGIIK